MNKDIIKDLLPVYTGYGVIGLDAVHAYWYDQSERIYVQYYKNVLDNITSLGFIINRATQAKNRQENRYAQIYKLGYKFREGSVPRIHHRNNSVYRYRGHGIQKELREGVDCKYVRTKRYALAKRLNGWDLFEGSFNTKGRGWKRTKKLKQWM